MYFLYKYIDFWSKPIYAFDWKTIKWKKWQNFQNLTNYSESSAALAEVAKQVLSTLK